MDHSTTVGPTTLLEEAKGVRNRGGIRSKEGSFFMPDRNRVIAFKHPNRLVLTIFSQRKDLLGAHTNKAESSSF